MSRYQEALKKSQEADAQRIREMEEMKIQVASGTLSPREEKKALKEIAKVEKMQMKGEFWGDLAEKMDSSGKQLQSVGVIYAKGRTQDNCHRMDTDYLRRVQGCEECQR